MVVTNNSNVTQIFKYRVNGEIKNVRILGGSSINLPDLVFENQVLYNFVGFRVNHINDLFPSRNLPEPFEFESSFLVMDEDAAIFMSTIGIAANSTVYYEGTAYERTGYQLCTYINELVLDLKGQGAINSTTNFWTDKNLLVFHPMIGGNASSHSYNLKDPNTYQISFQAGWIHSETGSAPNGATYADFGLSPSVLDGNNVNFGRYNGTAGNGGTVEMGASNASNTTTWAVFSNYGSLAYFTVGPYDTSAVDIYGTGLYATNRPGSNVTQGYRQGTKIAENTQTANLVTSNFYYGALNNGGTAGFFDSKELRSGHVLDGLSVSENETFYNIVQTYQNKLGRDVSIQNAYFYGDSTTQGAGASPTSNRWTTIVCESKGWLENNNGINGSSLESATPVDAISGPNMYDRRNTIPTYDSSIDVALFISYSINDCGINLPGYNTTTYSMQLGEIIDTAIAKGWPISNIILVIGLYCEESNWNDYVGFGIGVSVAATNTRHESFITAAGVVANTKGVKWINPYQDMINAGGTGPDGRHPNNAIYSVIANTSVLPAITDL